MMLKKRRSLLTHFLALFAGCMFFSALVSGVPAAASLLRGACRTGDLARVQLLVEQEGVPLECVRFDGATPLFIGAENGHLNVVQWLVGKGAEVNDARNDCATPLLVAAERGRRDVVQWLAEQGADLNVALVDGATPLCIAAQNGHFDVVQLLASRGAGVDVVKNDGATPLFIGAQNGHLDVVQYLVGQDADLNAALNDGATPLYVGAQNGNLDVVQLLVGEGAEVNVARHDGATPLYVLKDEQLIELLRISIKNADKLSYKVFFDEQRRRSKSWSGWFKNKASSVARSVVGGAKKNIYPLHEVSRTGDREMMRYLIEEQGHDCLEVNEEHRLPFHEAMLAGKWDASRYLLFCGLPSSVFGSEVDELLNAESIMNVNGRELSDVVLQYLFGFPYQSVIDSHEKVPDAFILLDDSVGHRISDRLLEKVKSSYEQGIWHVFPDDLKVRILRELVQSEIGSAYNHLTENQISLLALWSVCNQKSLVQMRRGLNDFTSKRGENLTITPEHFVRCIFLERVLPEVGTAYVGQRLLTE